MFPSIHAYSHTPGSKHLDINEPESLGDYEIHPIHAVVEVGMCGINGYVLPYRHANATLHDILVGQAFHAPEQQRMV